MEDFSLYFKQERRKCFFLCCSCVQLTPQFINIKTWTKLISLCFDFLSTYFTVDTYHFKPKPMLYPTIPLIAIRFWMMLCKYHYNQSFYPTYCCANHPPDLHYIQEYLTSSFQLPPAGFTLILPTSRLCRASCPAYLVETFHI